MDEGPERKKRGRYANMEIEWCIERMVEDLLEASGLTTRSREYQVMVSMEGSNRTENNQ